MKRIVIVVFAALAVLTSYTAVFHYSKEYGMMEGIKAYHQACYEVGGYIIGDTGEVVACKGQGVVPKEELKHFKSTI
jgi:hypothetical protein